MAFPNHSAFANEPDEAQRQRTKKIAQEAIQRETFEASRRNPHAPREAYDRQPLEELNYLLGELTGALDINDVTTARALAEQAQGEVYRLLS